MNKNEPPKIDLLEACDIIMELDINNCLSESEIKCAFNMIITTVYNVQIHLQSHTPLS